MAVRINPFHELYVGESVGADKFVSLFSDVIVKHALSLFQPGHVILKGLPGSGKSMLLNLLKPSIRVAYENSNHKFPVPAELMKFVGAGINLKRSGISDFGQRPIGETSEHPSVSPIYFGDFLNYWVVSDIFSSISKLSNDIINPAVVKMIGIDYDEAKLNQFAIELSSLDCWHGFLSGVADFADLTSSINKRITAYRAYLNYNSDDLPSTIKTSKSLIGVPISKTVQLLKKYGILEQDTEVYIRIDQYEELTWLDEATPGIGTSYQEMIHKLLGMRDSDVSYRLGTRYFAWTDDARMFGSAARLEKKRNYTEISIDSVLRRPENPRTWVFPEFAEDIFVRRLRLSPYKFVEDRESIISKVFGTRLSPSEIARRYVPNSRSKSVLTNDEWPDSWKRFLHKLAEEDPLSAKFAEAWARQKGKEEVVNRIEWKSPFPWDEKPWWKKERTQQALTQIASRNSQQLIWYGKEDLLGLSGGHILIFLSLCQHIWDVWLRDKRSETPSNELTLPSMDEIIQSAGVRETSNAWFEDISNEKGGRDRKLFISFIGSYFYKCLVDDKAMSYPGHNGFSLALEDLYKYDSIAEFIMDACNYGDLYDAPHTSKLRDKKQRRKFYINPIFSPYFKIPYSHTKEPEYIELKQIAFWLVDSYILERDQFRGLLEKPRERGGTNGQISFDF